VALYIYIYILKLQGNTFAIYAILTFMVFKIQIFIFLWEKKDAYMSKKIAQVGL